MPCAIAPPRRAPSYLKNLGCSATQWMQQADEDRPASPDFATAFQPVQGVPPEIPEYAGYPFKFLAQLAKARLAMSLERIFPMGS